MGLPYILTNESISPFTHYVKDGVITTMPSKASENHQFNYATESWELTDEQAGKINRDMRLELLISCDWTQLPDSPITNDKKSEWAAYRQQLRDLDMTVDPSLIAWPVEPSR
jgi:diketogulonate reductase-like aldo/keto reductase